MIANSGMAKVRKLVVGRYHLSVIWVIRAQFMVALVAIVISMVVGGIESALSAAGGALVAYIPNLYFSVKFGRREVGRSAKLIVRDFYVGEVVKLLLTTCLFAAVFQFDGVRYIPLFSGYMLVIVVFWFALLVRDSGL
jgi:ATP synthase protein I